MRLKVVIVAGLALLSSGPARSEGTVSLLDAAEVYCTDTWHNYVSSGVTYQRTMADYFAGGTRFCRVDIKALAGPTGNASAGWLHDPATRQTSVWCQATGGTGASRQEAHVRARFELYGLAGATDDPRCSPAREGHVP